MSDTFPIISCQCGYKCWATKVAIERNIYCRKCGRRMTKLEEPRTRKDIFFTLII